MLGQAALVVQVLSADPCVHPLRTIPVVPPVAAAAVPCRLSQAARSSSAAGWKRAHASSPSSRPRSAGRVRRRPSPSTASCVTHMPVGLPSRRRARARRLSRVCGADVHGWLAAWVVGKACSSPFLDRWPSRRRCCETCGGWSSRCASLRSWEATRRSARRLSA